MSGETALKGPDLGVDGVAAGELKPGAIVAGHFEGKPVVLVRIDSGLRAVGGKCTHYGGPLGDGLCTGDRIHCPWHHAVFDLSTGEAVGGPALDPIPVYEVVEREGRVFVSGPVDAPMTDRLPPGSPESIVILGAGAAGAAAAEALRRAGYTGPVTMIGGEPPVDRPNLSKDYLAGTAPEEWLPLRSAGFYAAAGIDLMTGIEVDRIDREQGAVALASDEEIGYGALLLATGAEPRRLDVEGADLPHVHYLRSLEDSRAIIAALDGVERAVVIGAGFIGLEVAASLRARGVAVMVVAPDRIVLEPAIGPTLGHFVEGLHREHGVEFRLGHGVTAIGARSVTLDDGEELAADLVVVGIGVVPRTGIAEAAGLDVDRGVVVDDRLRTSDPRIWAAGDVARYPGPFGETVRVEHWVAAERQGQAAALNMLGHDRAFTAAPFFWSQHYDVPINVTGYPGWDEEVVVGDADARDVIVGYRRDGRVRAVASIYRDRESLLAEQALTVGDQAALADLLRT